jgi:hypothetical protein
VSKREVEDYLQDILDAATAIALPKWCVCLTAMHPTRAAIAGGLVLIVLLLFELFVWLTWSKIGGAIAMQKLEALLT